MRLSCSGSQSLRQCALVKSRNLRNSRPVMKAFHPSRIVGPLRSVYICRDKRALAHRLKVGDEHQIGIRDPTAD